MPHAACGAAKRGPHGLCAKACAIAPAAWRCSPQSAAPHRASATPPLGLQNLSAKLFVEGVSRQQPDAAKLKADARNLVGIIGSDKTKTQTYCLIANVGEQMNQAIQAKDKKKFDGLAQKLPELEKNLGPEYLGLVESLGKMNLLPKDGQEIVSMFDKLDDSCPH